MENHSSLYIKSRTLVTQTGKRKSMSKLKTISEADGKKMKLYVNRICKLVEQYNDSKKLAEEKVKLLGQIAIQYAKSKKLAKANKDCLDGVLVFMKGEDTLIEAGIDVMNFKGTVIPEDEDEEEA